MQQVFRLPRTIEKPRIVKLHPNVLTYLEPYDYCKAAVCCKGWAKLARDSFIDYISKAFYDHRKYALLTVCVKNHKIMYLKAHIDRLEYPYNVRMKHLLSWICYVHNIPKPPYIVYYSLSYNNELKLLTNQASFAPINAVLEIDLELIEHFELADRNTDVFTRLLIHMNYPYNLFWMQKVYRLLSERLSRNREKYIDIYSQFITAADIVITPCALIVPSYCDITDKDWRDYLYFRNPSDQDWQRWKSGADTRYLKASFANRIPSEFSAEAAYVLAASQHVDFNTYSDYARKRALKNSQEIYCIGQKIKQYKSEPNI
jgi:hypothetical protein